MLNLQVVDGAGHPLIVTAHELFEEYAQELGVDLCFQGFANELADLPGKYAPPRGVLFVISDGAQPVACGALRELDERTCELKRIYVRPSHRGQGLGRQITLDLMERARQLHYSVVRLDTLRRLIPALALYESLGFEEIEPYNVNPEPDIVYFERSLERYLKKSKD